ncbi:hypothetical protein FB45DRAFT_48308 [Roridomyces roridus]|uniref:MYND-type domain-containing protein n=1 Tax=Roridomyces roridus TaxID=1738132 RepID=A0AAD7BS60_9AGAR|nr:hypothetical protein FB45DRAFT_48308 [Roridomyces roridus]
MHHALSLDALEHLPSYLRQSASAAAQGSEDDLRKMVLVAKEKPAPLSRITLPIFHAHLDPAKAEPALQKGTLTNEETRLLRLAGLAFQGLFAMQELPKEAIPDLWPGLWRWSQLLLRHPAWFSDQAYIDIIAVICKIHRSSDTFAKTIDAEPGFRVMLAQVWGILSTTNRWERGRQTTGFDSISYFLRSSVDLTNPQHLDDLIEGSGGNLEDFAALIVNFVTHLTTEAILMSFDFMSAALSVMEHTEILRPDFPELLLERGIIRALVTTLRKMPFGSLPYNALDSGYRILIAYAFSRPPCHVWFLEALQAGFLSLVASGLQNPRLIDEVLFQHSITDFLTSFLPYYSVLVKLGPQLADMGDKLDVELAERSPVWDAWEHFMESADEFMRMKQIYDSPDRVTMRACDNVDCNVLSIKSDFRRCSCCSSVYYCSQKCQRRDWKRGHRRTCAAIRAHSLENPDDILSLRDESFLRTVIHTSYQNQLSDILLSNMTRTPGKEYLVRFEYREGRFEAKSQVADEGCLTPLLGPIWRDQFSRARASKGRIHLHVLTFPSSARGGVLARVIPLRMQSAPAVGDGLQALRAPWSPAAGTDSDPQKEAELIKSRFGLRGLTREAGAREAIH